MLEEAHQGPDLFAAVVHPIVFIEEMEYSRSGTLLICTKLNDLKLATFFGAYENTGFEANFPIVQTKFKVVWIGFDCDRVGDFGPNAALQGLRQGFCFLRLRMGGQELWTSFG